MNIHVMKPLVTWCICLCIIAVRTNGTGGEWRNYSKLTTHQISTLVAAFTNNFYLNKTTLMEVALQTGLPKQAILRWFSNKRKRMKRGKIQKALSFS